MLQKEQLIRRWTDALEDNAEQQLHAMGMLDEAIDSSAATIPESLNALQRVTPIDQKKRSRILLFCAGLVLILFAIIAFTTTRYYPTMHYLWNLASWQIVELPQVSTSNPQEKFLLYGDTTRVGKANQMRALWESEPSNPAYFAEYARFYYEDNNALPADFLETAQRIDPDNGWFSFFAACVASKGAVVSEQDLHPRSPLTKKELQKLPYEQRELHKYQLIKKLTIKDAKRAEEAKSLWRDSLGKQKCDSYQLWMYQKRFSVLQEVEALDDNILTMLYLSRESSSLLSSRYISQLIAATLQRDDLTPQEKEHLMRDADNYRNRMLEKTPTSILNLLIRPSALGTITEQIRVMNIDGIDAELVKAWRQNADTYDEFRNNRSIRLREKPSEKWQGASYLTDSLSPLNHMLWSSIKPGQAELAPLRYAEQSFTLRITAIFFSLLFLIFFPFNLAFRRRDPLLRLGAEAWHGVSWRAHMKLIFWSMLLPLSYFACLYCFTPLAGKNTGIKEMHLVPYVPAACVGLIMLVLPRLLIHRTTKEWEMLCQQKKKWIIRMGWICVVLALIPMHALTFGVFANLSGNMLYSIVGTCMAPSLLWVIINGLRERFSRQPYRRVMHALRRYILLPCSAVAFVLISITIPVLHDSEAYWVKKDTLLVPSLDVISGDFEARVIKALDQQQKEDMGMK